MMVIQLNHEKVASTEGNPPKKKKGSRCLLNILQWGIVAVIFLSLGSMVWRNWIQVRDAPFTFIPFLLVLSTLIFVLSYLVQISAWYLITLKLKIALSAQETLESWLYSQMGKYLPGKVWLLLGRFYFYEAKGKPRSEITLALYFETITNLVAAGLLFLVSLFFFKELKIRFGELYRYLGLLFPLALLLLHPRILERIWNWTIGRFKKAPLLLSISYRDLLAIEFVCLLAWALGGLSFYLFVRSVFPVPVSHMILLAGSLAISCILGLAVLIAPSGLGVREGTLVYLLSFTIPGSVAVILSVMTRLWMTLIEIGLIGVVYLISRFRARPKEKDRYV